jgi:hypothetical protein
MAEPKNTNAAANKPKTGADLFREIEGDEVFANRPIIKFEDLKDQALPVRGWLVSREELRLPLGANRTRKVKLADGSTKEVPVESWFAFVVHLTQPTNAVDDKGNVFSVIAGREVYIAENPNNAARLSGYLGRPEMVEVALFGGEPMKMQGRNAMHTFEMKVTKNIKKREGAFLVGGATNNVTRQLTEGMLGIADTLAGMHATATQGQEVAAP